MKKLQSVKIKPYHASSHVAWFESQQSQRIMPLVFVILAVAALGVHFFRKPRG